MYRVYWPRGGRAARGAGSSAHTTVCNSMQQKQQRQQQQRCIPPWCIDSSAPLLFSLAPPPSFYLLFFYSFFSLPSLTLASSRLSTRFLFFSSKYYYCYYFYSLLSRTPTRRFTSAHNRLPAITQHSFLSWLSLPIPPPPLSFLLRSCIFSQGEQRRPFSIPASPPHCIKHTWKTPTRKTPSNASTFNRNFPHLRPVTSRQQVYDICLDIYIGLYPSLLLASPLPTRINRTNTSHTQLYFFKKDIGLTTQFLDQGIARQNSRGHERSLVIFRTLLSVNYVGFPIFTTMNKPLKDMFPNGNLLCICHFF